MSQLRNECFSHLPLEIISQLPQYNVIYKNIDPREDRKKFLQYVTEADYIWLLDEENFDDWVIFSHKHNETHDHICFQDQVVKIMNSFFECLVLKNIT